jgi:hypothetical protein
MGGGLFICKKKRWTCNRAPMSCARLEPGIRRSCPVLSMLHDYRRVYEILHSTSRALQGHVTSTGTIYERNSSKTKSLGIIIV